MENSSVSIIHALTHNDVYCTQCVLFGSRHAGGNRLKSLVANPLITYKKLTGKYGVLSTHLSKKYHQDPVLKVHEFVNRYEIIREG